MRSSPPPRAMKPAISWCGSRIVRSKRASIGHISAFASEGSAADVRTARQSAVSSSLSAFACPCSFAPRASAGLPSRLPSLCINVDIAVRHSWGCPKTKLGRGRDCLARRNATGSAGMNARRNDATIGNCYWGREREKRIPAKTHRLRNHATVHCWYSRLGAHEPCGRGEFSPLCTCARLIRRSMLPLDACHALPRRLPRPSTGVREIWALRSIAS